MTSKDDLVIAGIAKLVVYADRRFRNCESVEETGEFLNEIRAFVGQKPDWKGDFKNYWDAKEKTINILLKRNIAAGAVPLPPRGPSPEWLAAHLGDEEDEDEEA